MYHTIAFVKDGVIDLERSRKHSLERVLVRRGIPLQAQIKPYVIEGKEGPIEVADLFFDDGTATRMIAFAQLCFVS